MAPAASVFRPDVLAAVVLLALAGCTQSAPDRAASDGTANGLDRLSELVRLHEERDYFSLRERLGPPGPTDPPEIRTLRASVLHAFNEPERSNALLDTLLSEGTGRSDSLRYEARRIRYRNLLRLYRYPEARDVLERLVEEPPPFVDSARVRDFRNMRRLTEALADVPAQRVVRRSNTVLKRVGRGHVELEIDGSERDYPVDTGANLSVVIRSEAEELGLAVRPVGLDVGTSTDVRVTADVAVADRLRLGDVVLRNVVFLVVPDEVLTLPGLVIRGIIGFPVVEALGELRYRKDGAIEIPGEVPSRDVRNVSLHQLTPLVRVGYGDDQLVCGFDTGANRTQFYEPFLREHRERVEATGSPDTLRTAGAGGIRELPGYRLRDVTLRVGGASVTLPRIHVHTRVLVPMEEENVLDFNLGQDVLAAFDGYILNLRSMSLLLD